MRATTAIPPTNHAHSAARTPDPRSFARHPRPQYPPARASGWAPERHKPCCAPVERKTRSPTCRTCRRTCRITLPFPRRPGRCTLIGPNRSSRPRHLPSRRRTRPNPTRFPARHPIRSNPSNRSRRRSAIRRRSQRKRLRPPTVRTVRRGHGNVDTTVDVGALSRTRWNHIPHCKAPCPGSVQSIAVLVTKPAHVLPAIYGFAP
ncbi:hypothetical protein OKW41_009279 [Paraburkholderia sp. UCT70]